MAKRIRKVTVKYVGYILIEEGQDDKLVITKRMTLEHSENERDATQAEIDLIVWDSEEIDWSEAIK